MSPRIVSLRCVSDIHVDDPQNCRWLERLPERPDDVLMVAGDISDNLARAREALRTLKRKYGEVLCVPGNHDLWMGRDETESADSLQKLQAFLGMCGEEGVHTKPLVVRAALEGCEAGLSCCVVPLLSWHHQSFDTEPDIRCWEGIPRAEQCMVDYARCKWPAPLSQMDESVAKAVDALNEESLPEGAGSEALPIVSFSHFLPRLELSPEKRFLFLPTLNKAVGSSFLQARVERLGSALHIFGHTHFGWDATIGETRYVQAAVGYPSEWSQRPASMKIGALPEEPVVVWDTASGFVPPMEARWSRYYSDNARTAELAHVLAPWVAPMYRRLPGGEVCEHPMGASSPASSGARSVEDARA